MSIQIKKTFQNGSDQHFTLDWFGKPSKDQAEEINKLVNSWFEKGVNDEIYDGHFSFLSDIEQTNSKTYWWVDAGSAMNLDKAVSDLEKLLDEFNKRYSNFSQVISLFVGEPKKRFKWQKVTLGEDFDPFKSSYYYLVSENYMGAFGFKLENVGTITFTATPLAFIHFSQLSPTKRKRIRIMEKNKLTLEQVPNYSKDEYYKDKNLFPILLGIQSRKIKFPTPGNNAYYDFPIRCVLSIENLKFSSQGEQVMSSLTFEKWKENETSQETFYLYLSQKPDFLKSIKVRFEKAIE